MTDKPSRDGGFSDPSFISVGDPYTQKKDKPRGLGGEQKPFLTCPPKKGQTGSTFGPGFRKFDGLQGEYLEPYKLESKRRLENTKGFVRPNGFTFSSPTKDHTGSGDYFGAFGKFERDEDDIKKQQEENAAAKPNPKEKQFEKRNILTNPGKRGTFGYTGTMIGGSIPAMAAEFESERRKAKQDDDRHKQLMGDRKPFKSTTTGVDYFDEQEHVAAAKLLTWDEDCIVKPQDPIELMNPRERATARASTYKPWKPNNPIKEGEQGVFEKFPEQLTDPYDEKLVSRAMLPLRRNPVKIATQDLPESLKERKAFRPSSFPKAKLTKGTCLLGINKHKL
ncbi:hypothetical protein Poli38472_012753 [Pythium oligandrum]|uniref:Cilia-and flagella-associated protein 96 n=1 Tax=Pythium oligandrum TaxID=41045 RepID=A0A8K1FJ97_PYTOL|nr:hypothetical protein Poli38472_012753 [Pythium oligandrum]|eukprot:TMW61562.1 hypothetical protein Poli38472_012753 [Pythium oligandrum]